MLLPVGCGQQLRGGNEALNNYIKPDFEVVVKQKINLPVNFNFRLPNLPWQNQPHASVSL
jgi:hypothetical protein